MFMQNSYVVFQHLDPCCVMLHYVLFCHPGFPSIFSISLHKARRNDTPQEWLDKIPQMVKQLELSLYRSALCLEEYTDATTLRSRLQELATQILKKASHRSSCIGREISSSSGSERSRCGQSSSNFSFSSSCTNRGSPRQYDPHSSLCLPPDIVGTVHYHNQDSSSPHRPEDASLGESEGMTNLRNKLNLDWRSDKDRPHRRQMIERM